MIIFLQSYSTFIFRGFTKFFIDLDYYQLQIDCYAINQRGLNRDKFKLARGNGESAGTTIFQIFDLTVKSVQNLK